MRISKKTKKNQISIMEKKLEAWIPVSDEKTPPSGWIRAIRGSLGMSARQLAEQMNITQSTVHELENREAQKKVTLESLERAADALGCKLVYALVPKGNFNTLDDIIEDRAKKLAKKIVTSAEHSMKLELQGRSKDQLEKRIQEIANDLKSEADPRIWETKK